MNDINLSAGIRTNLLSLQKTSSLMARTQERLATGREVNSAVDDPTRFFAAQQHQSRATDLLALKSDMGEAIQTITAADKGITAIQSLLAQMKGVAVSARSVDTTNTTRLGELEAQFDDLTSQIADLAADSGYKGVNFLANSSLTVTFNEQATTSTTVTGADTAAGAYAPSAADFSSASNITAAIDDVTAATTAFRSLASNLSTSLTVIRTRQDFTQEMADTLQTGAENLVNADTNREGANLLALQTRQQLSTVALSLSSQASQSILQLF